MDMRHTLDIGKGIMSPETRNSQKSFGFFYPLLISIAIIFLWVVPVFVLLLQAGTPGIRIWGFVSIIALLSTIIAPLAYGWYSRDSTGAILIGALPFLLVTGVSRIIPSPIPPNTDYLVYSVFYFVSLSLVGGLEGYFATKKTTGYLLIALLLAGIWAGIFLSGIH
jgi:hypothetical protein